MGDMEVRSERNMGDFGIFLKKIDGLYMTSGNNRAVT